MKVDNIIANPPYAGSSNENAVMQFLLDEMNRLYDGQQVRAPGKLRRACSRLARLWRWRK